MKKIMTSKAVMLSMGLTVALSDSFAQEESPSLAETRASAGSAVSSPHPGDTKTAVTGSDAANGSVEVEVKVKEYTIEMPLSIAAGATTFKVTNTGKETHGFEIEGNGSEKQITPRLKEGESGSLRLNLKPGTYEVYWSRKRSQDARNVSSYNREIRVIRINHQLAGNIC